MYIKCAILIVIAITINKSNSVLGDKEKFEILKPSGVDELPQERRMVEFNERAEETEKNNQKSDNESDKTKESKPEKQTRTILGPLGGDRTDNLHCCGSRYDGGFSGRPDSIHSSSGLRASSSDSGRYPSRYDSRPEDRYGWQSYTPGSNGRHGTVGPFTGPGPIGSGGGGLYGFNNSDRDRYGTRPSYYGSDNDYDRPSNSGNRPGRPSYGHAYGDSGGYGSGGYEISRPGGYGGSSSGGGSSNRPPGGINFGGGGGRPGGTYGGHGVYGNIGEEDEFPASEDGPDAAGPPPHPGVNNLQTQKAVALKALAGVALIGAAAALASNPVLLPIGVLAGRRKRSIESLRQAENVDIDDLLKILENYIPKINKGKMNEDILNSPTCVAKLACQIQQEYIDERMNNNSDDTTNSTTYNSLKRRLMNLIQSKVIHVDVRYKYIKKLIKSAHVYEGNCDIFVCDLTKN